MEQNTAATPQDHHKRHTFVWKTVRPLAKLICFLKFGFRAENANVKGPYLLISNHVTDWDPILVGCSFSDMIYFVASEHLMRGGLGGKLVNWLMAPIARQKGGSAASTVLGMMRHLKKGYNVCVFPEGNRCWDGVTDRFLPSIGKVARTSGATLVTYKLEGGYFANPRWAGSASRRGKMRGYVVHTYAPEALKAMTPAQIYAHIEDDLREDAYERQRKDPVRFEGRRLAEHMETLLFLCPRCGRMHTLQSKNDTVRCWKCGFSFRYLPTGFLSGEDLPYDNLRDWTAWQKSEICRLCDEAGDRPVFTDTDITCHEVESSKGLTPIGKGEMKLYTDRLEIPGLSLPIKDITGIALRGPQDLYIGVLDHSYLLRSNYTRCMVKYLTACSHLNPDAEYGV